MSDRPTHVVALAGGCLAALLLLVWLAARGGRTDGASPAPAAPTAMPAAARPSAPDGRPAETTPARAPLGAHLRLEQTRDARPHEAVLTFTSLDAYRRFLARAAELGLTVLGKMDALLAVRVRYDSLAGLQSDLAANAADYADVSANSFINIPPVPAKEDRPAQALVPVGNGSLAVMGATGDRSTWGRGVTIAVLDSGVAPDATFDGGRVRYLDIGLGTTPGQGSEDGHGTAVAALAAGSAPDAPGVAPAAGLLSIRVTDGSGQSDIFTVAQAIVAAVDAGAQVINVSLGGYETNGTLANAIAYAGQRGAVVVASAGNDQAAQLTWPAADPQVVSVGAVDALEQQVSFSNSGPQLKLTAPGYTVQTAWLNGQRVYLDGTSASAPLAAGAIAALMSTNPGTNAAQAAQLLEQYASDGGAPGYDADYGYGVVNLGWAMNRNNPVYVDTAISSHYFDSANGQMEFVVQNRSGEGISGMVLNVETNGVTTAYPLPLVGPGASYVVTQAVDLNQLKANGSIVYRTQLANPVGTSDQVPANNQRTSVLSPPGK